MGECIIARSGTGSGSETIVATNLPVLNENYPVDGYFKYNEGIILSCMVDSYPVGCSFQWYCDDQPIEGAISETYNFMGTNEYKTHNIFCKVTNSLGNVYSRTASILEYPEVFYLVEHNTLNVSIEGTYTFSVNNEITSNSGKVFTLKNVPLSLYNNKLIIYVTWPVDGSYMEVVVNNDVIGHIDSDTGRDTIMEFSISNVNKDCDIAFNNEFGDGNVFIKYICIS